MHILTCYCVTQQNDAEELDTASSSVFDIDGSIEYLQSLSRGNKSYNVAKAIAADISLFFERISHGATDTYYDILLNTRNLYDYIKHFYKSINSSHQALSLRNSEDFVKLLSTPKPKKTAFRLTTNC